MSSYTTSSEVDQSHQVLRDTFATGRTKSIKWRKWQLKALWWLIADNEDRLVECLSKDMHRHAFETITMELRAVRTDIIDMLEHVDEWAKGDKPDAGFIFGTLGKAWLSKVPLGSCLIIGAWNFPLFTLLSPAVAAIAAGNCVLMKPSELASSTSAALADLIPKYMDQTAIRVATGGGEEVTHMLRLKWDHIFYTGGSKVGRIIAKAAAEHLTPIALELGGQSPVIVGKSASIDLAAKRIVNAKFTNGGQVCLNANHVFADAAVHDQLIERMIYWYKEFTKGGSGGMAHIINERHYDRISKLLKSTSGEIVFGGSSDRSKNYIQPTIVKDVMTDDSLLSEELFAPITPMIVADVNRAIRIINSMPHPLGLYIFSNDQAEIDHILNNTTSGGATINDVMIHAAVPNAPFGGVGESGYGSYHGKFGFDTFSHTRTIVSLPLWMDKLMSFRYPPFDIAKAKNMEVKSSLIGKKGETMEDQKVGKPMGLGTVLKNALMVTALLAVMDSASGGKLLFVHTLQDVFGRFRGRV